MQAPSSYTRPPGGVELFYQDALDHGQFMLQQCDACGAHVFFPREICPHCGGARLTWQTARGAGTVHAVTTVRRKPEAGGDYNVSLIDLDEGVRLMSRVEGVAAAEVRIGLRVYAQVTQQNGHGLLLFRATAPAETTA
jgi:uncharacterized OB-fold protein